MPVSCRVQRGRECKRFKVRQPLICVWFKLNVLIFVVCSSGRTPLHWSSKNGHVGVCQFLVSSNADANAKDNLYDSCIYTLFQICGLRLLIFFERFNPILCFRERTPLHWSSQQGHVAVSQFLVSSNADVVAKDKRYVSHSHINTLELAVNIFSFVLND